MDMLVALIIAPPVSTYFGWSTPKPDGKTIISVVGTVPAALPSFHIPEINFEWVNRLLGSALARTHSLRRGALPRKEGILAGISSGANVHQYRQAIPTKVNRSLAAFVTPMLTPASICQLSTG